MGEKTVNSLFLHAVEEDEICKIIKTFDAKKSVGPNSFPIRLLNDFCKPLAKPLSHIINLSFTEGMFPKALKTAKVIPIYKKGDATLCSNYRPISLLPIFSKLFEKRFYKRLYSFFEKHKLIYEKQFGFRREHSTNQALISPIETIKQHLDQKKLVCGVFIDLQKAFDTFDHQILLNKLYHYGIRGEAFSWAREFLSNRKQFVNLSGINSMELSITCRVPQGSTLGPLSFLIYINDLHRTFNNCTVHHFADDTNLFCASKNVQTIQSVVNRELKILVQWLRANKLSLNENKTELIIFHSPKKHVPDISIKINNFKLSLKHFVSYLGISIDEVLSWNKQFELLSKTLNNTVGILSKHFTNHSVLSSVYYAIFYAHILYGCLVWQFSSKSNIEKLIKLLKKCIRITTFSSCDAHSNPLFFNLKLLKVEDIFHSQLLALMFDFFSNKLPATIRNFFTPSKDIHSYNTRSTELKLLKVPKVATSLFGVKSIFSKVQVLGMLM